MSYGLMASILRGVSKEVAGRLGGQRSGFTAFFFAECNRHSLNTHVWICLNHRKTWAKTMFQNIGHYMIYHGNFGHFFLTVPATSSPSQSLKYPDTSNRPQRTAVFLWRTWWTVGFLQEEAVVLIANGATKEMIRVRGTQRRIFVFWQLIECNECRIRIQSYMIQYIYIYISYTLICYYIYMLYLLVFMNWIPYIISFKNILYIIILYMLFALYILLN